MAQRVKNPPAMQEMWVRFLDRDNALEEGMEPTPVFLPGEYPWTEEPSGLVHGVAKGSDTTEHLVMHAHSCMVNNNEFKRNERIRSYALQEACENKIHRYRWMLE